MHLIIAVAITVAVAVLVRWWISMRELSGGANPLLVTGALIKLMYYAAHPRSAQRIMDAQRNAQLAAFKRLGYDPVQDLDREAIVKRGGDDCGHFYLFKCPQCSHPLLAESEATVLHTDLNDLAKLGCINEDPVPCPRCGFVLDEIWDCSNKPDSYERWLLTPEEIRARGIQWILRPGVMDEDGAGEAGTRRASSVTGGGRAGAGRRIGEASGGRRVESKGRASAPWC